MGRERGRDMLKVYAGHIRKFNIGGLLPERLYAVIRVDLYGNTLAPFYEGFTTGRVFLHNDWCEIRKQRDGRWRVYPLSAELAALLRANGVNGLPPGEELEPSEGDNGGWYPGYGGGTNEDKDKDGDGDTNTYPTSFDPSEGTGETFDSPKLSWHHCTIEKYYPDGLPDGKMIDPDWEPSTPTADYTVEGSCPLDPNFPPLIHDYPRILGFWYMPDPETVAPTEECPEGATWRLTTHTHTSGYSETYGPDLVCVNAVHDDMVAHEGVGYASDSGSGLYYFYPSSSDIVTTVHVFYTPTAVTW